MKNKKGFTLIELLAIIVILAVIAVITTPIILNVIENAKKGAAQDSALGYKDAVHKYYASRLSNDSSFQMVNNDYVINSDGYLSYTDSDNSENDILYEIAVSGKVPNNGFVRILNNKVTDACIGFDEYAVLIVDGNVSDTAKGVCSSISDISTDGEGPLEVGTEYLFPYVSEGDNKEQTLEIVKSGYYRLEVWGAQGGSANDGSVVFTAGYGGYSTGVVYLSRGTNLFVNVGGSGKIVSGQNLSVDGGYNGGGNGYTDNSWTRYAGSGGGATHIALSSGTLSSFDANGNGVADANEIGDILIVAGGGAGTWHTGVYNGGWESRNIGHGGGYAGTNGTGVTNWNTTYGLGGTQSSGYAFGQGKSNCPNGAGGGFYGGNSSGSYAAGGGSGYIGNSRIVDGVMYCYGCNEYGGDGIKTISTTGNNKDSVSCPNGYSSDPLRNCAKGSDGYAKVTYIGKQYVSSDIAVGDKIKFSYVTDGDNKEQTIKVPKTGYYKLEVWGAQGGTAANGTSYVKTGGYGGYSSGIIRLEKGTDLYVNVGGAGSAIAGQALRVDGGYNGGGFGYTDVSWYRYAGSGGGATHIALVHGILSELGDYKGEYDSDAGTYRSDDILIVAGGGAGTWHTGSYGDWETRTVGQAGGASGKIGTGVANGSATSGTGGTQTTGYAFGQGKGDCPNGAGGGFYGGTGGGYAAGGGSGYIGNPSLSSGVMYCYGCDENAGSAVKTISTTGSNKDSVNCPDSYSSNPLSNCAKAGDGYAVITYIGESLN